MNNFTKYVLCAMMCMLGLQIGVILAGQGQLYWSCIGLWNCSKGGTVDGIDDVTGFPCSCTLGNTTAVPYCVWTGWVDYCDNSAQTYGCKGMNNNNSGNTCTADYYGCTTRK